MSVRRSLRLKKQCDGDESILSPTKTPQSTPLSKELRKMINQNSIMSVKTKNKFITDLDRHIEENNSQWKNKMRTKIIEEIIASEQSYVHQLEILIKFFMTPLKKVDYISSTECNTLFYNIESLERISRELTSQLTSDDNIGTAFINMAPYFKVYSLYAYNYNSVLQILQNISETNKKLSSFIGKQETRPEVSSKITALLITPIQRVPRYRLLLKEVLNYTTPDHPHYASITKALQLVTSTTDHINQLVLEQQHMTRLVEVQRNLAGGKPTIVVPGRQLVREGTLMKMSMKGGNKKASAVYIVLLSDMILYCKEWKVSEKLRCERVLPVSKCTVNKLMFKQGLFNLRCQSVSYILYSPTTSEEGNEWYNAIKKAIEEHQAKFQTLRKKYSSRKALKRKDLDKLNDAVTLKQKRKRKASDEDGDTSSDCGFHSPWKVLKLSSTLIPTTTSRVPKETQPAGPCTSQGGKQNTSETTPTNGGTKASNMSYENAVASGNNEKSRVSASFTHTLMVQAKTVVTMLGESMKRYLLACSNSAR
uniref:FYVE, RhoGEF and PH domain-containing protein 3 n=1 Tax=Cacopsylla melanoneura TaxID=428564 RepID=A0A8D8QLK9_9HEMI